MAKKKLIKEKNDDENNTLPTLILKNKKEYNDNQLITFGITIDQKYKEDETKWKKELYLPKKWSEFKINNESLTENNNGLGMLTGEKNNIFVIDIDNVDDWIYLLESLGESEPDTVKAISGNGGIHLFFKYDERLKNIKSKDRAICYNGKKLQIDVKTNGGFIIVYPSSYYNKNVDKVVTYKWKKSILKYKPLDLPEWLEILLLDKQTKLVTNVSNKKVIEEDDDIDEINDKTYEENDFSDDDIKKLCNLLSDDRIDNYKEWIDIGMCLKNLSDKFFKIWLSLSKKSNKFDENECVKKWKSFKKAKNGLQIGSLIKWALDDNNEKCRDFLKEKDIKLFVEKNKNKFPNNDLEISNIIKNGDYHYLSLKDTYCPIKSSNHGNNNMYLELTPYELVMKCNICVGCKYPCEHIKPSTEDIKKLFNVNIDNLIINNYYGNQDTKDIVINDAGIFDDPNFNVLITNSLNGTHYDIAEALFYKVKSKYVFSEKDTDSDIKIWYEFDTHRWNNSIKLRNLISTVMPTYYQKIIDKYNKIKTKSNESEIVLKIKKINDIIRSLKTSSIKNNIMTELEELSQVETKGNFFNKLDSNCHLLGFNNGVFDFKLMKFRNGEPEDLINMSCGYDYVHLHTENYDNLKQFLEDIQPDETQREYLLTYLSTCLAGKNHEELFTVLTGSGRNGKSKLVLLIKKTFGDYFASVTSKLFTRPRPDANSPDPGLLHLIKKRVVVASEPEKNDKLNSGFIKFITGGDSTLLRKCHGNTMQNFQANFITFLVCNDIPDIDEMDNAFSKRLRCIGFENIFVDDPKEKNEKKINKNIEFDLDLYVQDFMLLLIEKYTKYVNNERQLTTTPKIMEVTNSYKEEVDIYYSFLNARTEEYNSNILMSELYEDFKIWYKNNNPNTKLPNNRNFNNGIKKYKKIEKSVRVGNKVSVGIKNLKLIDIDDTSE